MEYKASNWWFPILVLNALMGLAVGPIGLTSSKIPLIVSIGLTLYGLLFLWSSIVFVKNPVYTINGRKLEILKLFKNNVIVDLADIDRFEETRGTYFLLYSGKKVNAVSSVQIGNKKYVELIAAIKQVITNHSSATV